MENNASLVDKAKEACTSQDYSTAKKYVDAAVSQSLPYSKYLQKVIDLKLLELTDGKEPNYYILLGLEPTANEDEIRRAHKSVRNLVHPDKTQGFFLSEEIFRLVERARDTLLKSRDEYDQKLAAESNIKPAEQPQLIKHFFYRTDANSAYFSQEAVFGNNSPPASPEKNDSFPLCYKFTSKTPHKQPSVSDRHYVASSQTKEFSFQTSASSSEPVKQESFPDCDKFTHKTSPHQQKTWKATETVKSHHQQPSVSDWRYKATKQNQEFSFKTSGRHHHSEPVKQDFPIFDKFIYKTPPRQQNTWKDTETTKSHPKEQSVSDWRYKATKQKKESSIKTSVRHHHSKPSASSSEPSAVGKRSRSDMSLKNAEDPAKQKVKNTRARKLSFDGEDQIQYF